MGIRAATRERSGLWVLVPIYLRHIAITALVVGCAFSYQLFFVYEEFAPRMVVAPLTVTLFIGFIWGRIAILKSRLERSSEQFRAVADLAEEFIFYRRSDGEFEYASPACRAITGYQPNEFIKDQSLMQRIIHPDDQALWQHHEEQLIATGMPHSLDVRLLHRNGNEVWVSHMAVPVYDTVNNRVVGVRATSLDITQRKRYEEEIERQAHYDALTGLPNRRLLAQQMAAMITANSENQQRFAVLFLDLDRFKYLNDSHGHQFGDELLKILGRRLRDNAEECCIVSHLGGDEFVILLPQVVDAAAAEKHARHLLEIVEIPLMIDGVEYSITGSIGVAVYPEDGAEPATLIRNADAAMFRSKLGTHGKVQHYVPSIVSDVAAFIEIEGMVRRGLRQGEFLPYYQPKVALDTRAIVGYEALARWRRGDGTMGSPEQFIHVAQETGMIRTLGEQMLNAVCNMLHEWQSRGSVVPIAVNISGQQFTEPGFVEGIEHILHSYRIPPALLVLEITEQALISDIDEAVARLSALRALGIRIALDDFGTGYSSLNYLSQLPIDEVKIDRSFVCSARQGGKKMQMLRSIINLCHELQLEIVAEGIETEEHLRMLQEMGCRVGQGYYFHRPMPAQEIATLH